MYPELDGLDFETIDATMKVPAGDQNISRSIIGNAIVIYNTDNPPKWLTPILEMQDENGDVITAFVDRGHNFVTVEYSMNTNLDPRKNNSTVLG